MGGTLERFFACLSERMYKENDLSDITYALINTSEDFKRIFISFITKSGKKQAQCANYEVSREFPLDDRNRPDFLFIGGNEAILLENKVWDRDYHFKDYSDALLNQMSSHMQYQAYHPLKALISAHILGNQDIQSGKNHGFEISYWHDFIALLKDEIAKGAFAANKYKDDQKDLINGYVKYLEEVVKVPEIGRIQFTKETLKSIIDLSALMKLIVRQHHSQNYDYELTSANTKLNTGNSTGIAYIITKNGSNKRAFVNFYLQYDYKGSPAIIIDLPLNVNKDINDRITSTSTGTYVFEGQNLEPKEGCAFIMADIEGFLESDKKGQEQKIKDFFQEANGAIEKYI